MTLVAAALREVVEKRRPPRGRALRAKEDTGVAREANMTRVGTKSIRLGVMEMCEPHTHTHTHTHNTHNTHTCVNKGERELLN